MLQFFIQGSYNFNNELKPCKGVINFLRKEPMHQTIYAEWCLYGCDEKIIAASARQYYLWKEKFTIQEALSKVIDHINGYRIARKRIFSNLEVML